MHFFVNQCIIEILPEDYPLPERLKGKYLMGSADTGHIFQHYQLVHDGKIKGNAHMIFLVRDLETTWLTLLQHFELVEAAGGLVEKAGEYLFILRKGKWDLPKGKIEEAEQVTLAAEREVEEECGITATVAGKILDTWHTYAYNGQPVMKKTSWFFMKTSDTRIPRPQIEEEIEAAVWLAPSEIGQKVKQKTYPSILEVLSSSNL